MSFGKSSGSSAPVLTQEQKDAISAQTNALTGTFLPAYQNVIGGATNLYNQNAGGILNAAQNLAGTAGQAQQTLGETGESALRTGVSGLQSLFSPNYEANQVQAALAPAQAQYQQNLANQQMQFGGTGNLGSARQALAGQQLAGATQAQQAQTAAQVQRDIAAQRMGVGSTLANLGQGGLGQAIGAAGQQVTAAKVPMDAIAQIASIYYGVPTQSYVSNFGGTQGQVTSGSNYGIKI